MKKSIKYLMSMLAVALMAFTFAACTNEDDVDLGPVARWSVECTSALNNGQNLPDVVKVMNKEICKDVDLYGADDATKPEASEDLTDPKDENGEAIEWSETQARYYLQYAVVTADRYLGLEANQAFRQSIPDGTVITFTLSRVGTGDKKITANRATVTVSADKIILGGSYLVEQEDK